MRKPPRHPIVVSVEPRLMKAIVIGSGVAGLASAIRLEAKGYEVTVFEAGKQIGGKLGEIRAKGFRWDKGPSLFTLPAEVDNLFHCHNLNPRDYFNYLTHDISCKYFFDGGKEFTAFTDSDAFEKEVDANFPSDADAVKKYLKKSSALYDQVGDVFLNKSLHKGKSLMNFRALKALTSIRPALIAGSMHSRNARAFSNPELIQIFDRYATYNGSSPYKAPGILTMIPHLEQNMGTFLPKKGMRSIVDSIHRLADEIGISIETESPVERITSENGAVTGVVSQGKYWDAEVVLSNVDVYFTYRNLLPSINAPERKLRQERSSSAIIFYWGVRGEFSSLDLHNILFSKDYPGEFKSLFDEKELFHDPTVYINITSKLIPEDAPQGHENWFVMINAPSQQKEDWSTTLKKARRLIIDKINASLNINLEERIVVENHLHPGTIESQTGSYLGALYGTSSNHPMSAFLRHPNFSRNLRGLYFAGGSVHPGGGIPLCLKSAKIATDLVKRA